MKSITEDGGNLLTRSFVRGFVVSTLMLLVLTLIVRAQTTPPSATQDTAVGDTLAGAAQNVQAPAQTAPAQTRPTAEEAVRTARQTSQVDWTGRLISLVGMFVMLGLGWLLSVNRKAVQWNVVIWGTVLQLVFAIIILKTPFGQAFFNGINNVVVGLLGFTVEGARFLFGDLVFNNVPVGTGDPGNVPMTPAAPGMVARTGAFFAFNVLPTIIFFSSLMTVLYYMGVMQKVVKGMAWVMMRTMRTSGAETLSAAGNIFLGQTEAPLLIKPFVKTMTNSELFAVMTGGFATVAGGVMAAYVGMLLHLFPDIAGHLMAASVMSAPAGLVFAKMMYPETEEPLTRGSLKVDVENPDTNVIDAAARGAGEGLQLALNVAAMLLAFIALIALLNALISWSSSAINLTGFLQARGLLGAGEALTLQAIMGWLLAPLAWLMGVPWKDAPEIGTLLGIKTALNEFVAYLQLTTMITEENLSPRSVVIATYALCGFANFSSIAIQIGGIGGLAPNRRHDLAKIGFRAMLAGTLASFMTANIAGALI
jgi:CNT family concentrative nucleoside transporter